MDKRGWVWLTPEQHRDLWARWKAVLRRLSKRYDFYFPTDEGYFDE